MRKGQFFIIGAVVVVISLFSLQNLLNQAWQLDSSEMQGEDIGLILIEIQRTLDNTIQNSDTNLENNLELLIALLKDNLIIRGYRLEIKYTIDVTEVLVELKIQSKDIYLEKDITITR